ncbi:MAG: hypothetical protein JO223_24760 [Hyphomicrobiales bacterium]|nr:hypothetical protein [Hyphomicrobiales bacterium]
MNKQNPIRAHKATKIRYFSDRLLGARDCSSGRDEAIVGRGFALDLGSWLRRPR